MRNSLLVVLLAVIVMVGHLSVVGWHLKMPDTTYYASTARQLLQTGRYQGVSLRLNELRTIDQTIDHDRPWPVSYCRPGFPLLLAGFFAVLGASDITYQIVNILSFCLLAWAVYRISTTINGSVRSGWYSLGLLIAIPVVLSEGTRIGLEMPFAALILLTALLLLQAKHWPAAVAAGAGLAMAMFMRPTALGFLPLGLLAGTAFNSSRRTLLLVFAVTFIVLTMSGHVIESAINPPPRNPAKPFNLTADMLMWKTEHYGEGVVEEASWAQVATHWRDVVEKFARSLNASWGLFVFVTPFWLVALAIWQLAKRQAGSKILPLAAVTAASALLIVLGINLTSPEALGRHLLPVGALLAALAGGGLGDIVSRSRARFSSLVHLFLVIVLISVISYSRLFVWAEQVVMPTAFLHAEREKVGIRVRKYTSADDIILGSYCGVPFVNWYGQRRAVGLPSNPADVGKVVHELVPVDAVLVCADHSPAVASELEELLPDFTLVDSFQRQGSVYHCHYKLYVRERSMSLPEK